RRPHLRGRPLREPRARAGRDRRSRERALSAIDPETLKAYRETEYRVFAEPTFTMRVEVHSPELARLHAERGVRCSAFLTACNPCSRGREGGSNEARQAKLERELRERGLAYVPGIGQHPSGSPPGEP